MFREHFITCFIDDKFGIQNRSSVGVDSICYECDYPHSDSLWPLSPERMIATLDGVSDSDVNKITHLNAMRVLKYDPFGKIDRTNCTVGALRAQARHVSTTPVSRGGGKPLDAGVVRPVTTGDVLQMMRANAGEE